MYIHVLYIYIYIHTFIDEADLPAVSAAMHGFSEGLLEVQRKHIFNYVYI